MTYTEATAIKADISLHRWHTASRDWHCSPAATHRYGQRLVESMQDARPSVLQAAGTADLRDGMIIEVDGAFYRWAAASQSWHVDTPRTPHCKACPVQGQDTHPPVPQVAGTADISDGMIVEVDGTFYRWAAASQSWHVDTVRTPRRETHVSLPLLTRAILKDAPSYGAHYANGF